MTAVNFMPWRKVLQRHQRQQNLLCFVLPLMLCVVVSGAMVWCAQGKIASDSIFQQQWQQGNDTLHARLQAIAQQSQQRDILVRRWQHMQEGQRRAVRWHQRLTLLVQTLPEALWLSEVTWLPPYLRVTGFALHFDEVARWQKALSNRSTFSQVMLHHLEQKDRQPLNFVLQLAMTDEEG